ncbi:hypothetical protein EPN52_11625 [bacterium]|nr:MAG: hypothetical protein EPN52_11625 [bacterium]
MKLLRPYGDTADDGAVQLSFTLPMAWSEAADEAARRLVSKMGFTGAAVVEGRSIAAGFSFFVIYARTPASVDVSQIAIDAPAPHVLSLEQVDAFIRREFGRKLVVAGACIGTDAHTVGIDAIMNMKGCHGDYGLERYHELEAYNLGAQVSAEEFVRFARERRVDVLLASQVVTQKGSDVRTFTALAELVEAEELRERMVLICGGPRVTNLLAQELGYDAGFGRGTLPSEVATFFVHRLREKLLYARA